MKFLVYENSIIANQLSEGHVFMYSAHFIYMSDINLVRSAFDHPFLSVLFYTSLV